jgi:hypothetical protein
MVLLAIIISDLPKNFKISKWKTVQAINNYKSASDNDWWSILSSFKQSRVANKVFIILIVLQ